MKNTDSMKLLWLDTFQDYFELHEEDNWVMLRLPNSSLAGSGETFADAFKDLIDTFLIVRMEFNSTPIDKLTQDAIEFREWLNNPKRQL